jgi:hypothetical protein
VLPYILTTCTIYHDVVEKRVLTNGAQQLASVVKTAQGIIKVLHNLIAVYILGISAYYHDSATDLLADGIIVAAAQEERFSRKKHDARFPGKSIRYCLS